MSDQRKPDRRRLLEALSASGGPMTTAQIATAIQVDLHRMGEIVGDLVTEGVLERGNRRDDGWEWRLAAVGSAELQRAIALEVGR